MTGPKPAGPTHPTPTHPPKQGHQPLGYPLSGPRRSAADAGPDSRAGAGSLAELIGDLSDALRVAIAIAGRQYVGPRPDDEPVGPAYVDRQLGNVVASLRGELARLGELALITLPARQDPAPAGGLAVATTGGPVDHPDPAPGEADAPLRAHAPVVRESPGSVVDPGAGDSFSLPPTPAVPEFATGAATHS